MCFFTNCQSDAHKDKTVEVPSILTEEDTVEAPLLEATDWPDEVIGLTETWKGDLDSMIERRRIRVLVPYSRTSYHIDGAERHGIAYESLMHFEEEFNQQLDPNNEVPHVRVVFMPITREKILPALIDGYGDLAVANLTITPGREAVVDFSMPSVADARDIGRETVQYVSNIYKYYISYRSFLLYSQETGKDMIR